MGADTLITDRTQVILGKTGWELKPGNAQPALPPPQMKKAGVATCLVTLVRLPNTNLVQT
ncbi:hypothetical protein AKJ29_15300 [Aliiroseovarius crassostreae]|uniref:Uncharacterized protein n=1 Tax=Aliiroseovarius crassostreae TaxID=154981 RepID=A0A0N8IBT8_9RHOB|nr:hypothetical protein AKJ29_15300 [Aliiroseovarius crassostreae]